MNAYDVRNMARQMNDREKIDCIVELIRELFKNADCHKDTDGFNAFMFRLIQARDIYDFCNGFHK